MGKAESFTTNPVTTKNAGTLELLWALLDASEELKVLDVLDELENELEKELKDALLLRVLPSELGAELLSELARELLTL